MTLRERIAETMWTGLPYRWPDRPELLAIADAILDLPELRALAAGKPLWVECETCGGIGSVSEREDGPNATHSTRCPARCRRGFVPVGQP